MTAPIPAPLAGFLRPFRSKYMLAAGRGGRLAALMLVAILLALPAAASKAEAASGLSDAGRQLRIGAAYHDLEDFGGSEDGEDVTVELRGAPLAGAFWQRLLSPRLHVGANINNSGNTSSVYTGLTWIVDIGSHFYASVDFGGALHNGKLEEGHPGRAALGSRLLFREALELGVRFGSVWRLGVRADHMSNADLAPENDGITDLGLVLSRQF